MARTLQEANLIISALEAKIRELEELTLDYLTGLPQRKVIQDVIEEEILRFRRTQNAFSILVVDLNYLKTVNDSLGHPEGDKMIISFVAVMKKSLRVSDVIARVGGDEFIVFLPDQDEEQVLTVKAHLLEKFEESKLSMTHFRGAAIGVSTVSNEHYTFKELFEIADKGMYAHKVEMKQGT